MSVFSLWKFDALQVIYRVKYDLVIHFFEQAHKFPAAIISIKYFSFNFKIHFVFNHNLLNKNSFKFLNAINFFFLIITPTFPIKE